MKSGKTAPGQVQVVDILQVNGQREACSHISGSEPVLKIHGAQFLVFPEFGADIHKVMLQHDPGGKTAVIQKEEHILKLPEISAVAEFPDAVRVAVRKSLFQKII